jgi:hypothetical protein
MITIIHENTAPRGGWTYVCPITQVRLNNSCLWVLREKVEKHCSINKLEFSETEFRTNVCRNSPYAQCQDKTQLGDVVYKVASPIAAAIDAATGGRTNVKGCGGCRKRREKLNLLSEKLSK